MHLTVLTDGILCMVPSVTLEPLVRKCLEIRMLQMPGSTGQEVGAKQVLMAAGLACR